MIDSKIDNRGIYAALLLPVMAGVLNCVVLSSIGAFLVSSVAVIATAILVMKYADKHGEIDRYGRPRESGLTLLIGMLLLWLPVYPYAFVRRRAFVSPSLVLPAMVVTAFFVASPLLRLWLHPVQLPVCTSPEVIDMLDKLARQSILGGKVTSIDGHYEVYYNQAEEKRYGECLVHLTNGELPVKYMVSWKDKRMGVFEVRIEATELPNCRSADVVSLLESMIRKSSLGRDLVKVDGVREVKYDKEKPVRYGECIAHTGAGEIPVTFELEWTVREKGRFQVRITSPEIMNR